MFRHTQQESEAQHLCFTCATLMNRLSDSRVLQARSRANSPARASAESRHFNISPQQKAGKPPTECRQNHFQQCPRKLGPTRLPNCSLTTEHEPKIRAHTQQSQTATANTMPPIRRHQHECTSAAKQLDDRVEPKARAQSQQTQISICQHDATNQTTPFRMHLGRQAA